MNEEARARAEVSRKVGVELGWVGRRRGQFWRQHYGRLMTYLEPTEHRLEEEDNLAVPLNRMTVACRVATSSSAFSCPRRSRETLTKVLQTRIKQIQELPHRAQQLPRLEMEEDDVEDRGDVEEGLGQGGEGDEVESLRKRVDGLFVAFLWISLSRLAKKGGSSPPATLSQPPSASTSSSPSPPRSPVLPLDPAPLFDRCSTPPASSAEPDPAGGHRERRARRLRRWR